MLVSLTSSRNLSTEKAAAQFFNFGLINMVIAVAATVPVLIPELGLPLKLQVWPGTWMFVAYFSFLIAGVIGMMAWSYIYLMSRQLLGTQSVSRIVTYSHLALFETGVLGATGLMGLFPGYIGGTLIHDGIGQFVVTRQIEWAVIPIGFLIFVAAFATLTGVLNVVFLGEKVVDSAVSTKE
jgi:hypothetical protein